MSKPRHTPTRPLVEYLRDLADGPARIEAHKLRAVANALERALQAVNAHDALLREYGRHHAECELSCPRGITERDENGRAYLWRTRTDVDPPAVCTCGFAAALALVEQADGM